MNPIYTWIVEARKMSDKKEVRKIESEPEARAFALFLAREKERHLEDVIAIEKDLDKLCSKWHLERPDRQTVDGVWWEV